VAVGVGEVDDDLDERIVEQFAEAGVGARAVVPGEPGGSVGVGVVDADEPQLGMERQRGGVVVRHVAGADECDADRPVSPLPRHRVGTLARARREPPRYGMALGARGRCGGRERT
jgi:hypothetical protein